VTNCIQYREQIAKRLNSNKIAPKNYRLRQHLHFGVRDIVDVLKLFVLSELVPDRNGNLCPVCGELLISQNQAYEAEMTDSRPREVRNGLPRVAAPVDLPSAWRLRDLSALVASAEALVETLRLAVLLEHP
jgi:hypothetical protein